MTMMSSATARTPPSVLNLTVCPCAVSTCQLTATSVGSKSVSGMGIRTVATGASMSPVSISEQRDGIDLTNLDQRRLYPGLDGQHSAVDGGDQRGVVGFGLVGVEPGECA